MYHRCFRLLLRIVRISVYYDSSDQFSFHKKFEFKRKNNNFLVADYRLGRKYSTVAYGFILIRYYFTVLEMRSYNVLNFIAEIGNNVINVKNVGFKTRQV